MPGPAAGRKHGGNWSRIFADDTFAALRKYEARDLAARWQALLRRDAARCVAAPALRHAAREGRSLHDDRAMCGHTCAREAEEVERAESGLPQPSRRAAASRPARSSPTPASRAARWTNGGDGPLAAPLKSPVRHRRTSRGRGSTSPLQRAGGEFRGGTARWAPSAALTRVLRPVPAGSMLRSSGKAEEEVERERRAREAAEARARKEAAARRTLEKRLGSMESMLSTYVQAKSGKASHRVRQSTPGPHSPGGAKFGV